MAPPSASFTSFFCLLFLFTLSSARTPLDLPAIRDTNHDSLSESDQNSAVANTIFLPSDKFESEPVTEIKSEPDNPDFKTSKPDAEVEPLESTDSSDRAPITMISFRPVNRHIPHRPLPLSFRIGHRCRHNHEFKPWNPRLPRRQIPYGNDMILSNGEDRSFDLGPDGGVRQIPVRWTRFRRVDPRFSDEPGMERIEVMRRPHHHHHHDHEDDHHYEHFPERDHDDEGLMKRIRKFLHHF